MNFLLSSFPIVFLPQSRFRSLSSLIYFESSAHWKSYYLSSRSCPCFPWLAWSLVQKRASHRLMDISITWKLILPCKIEQGSVWRQGKQKWSRIESNECTCKAQQKKYCNSWCETARFPIRKWWWNRKQKWGCSYLKGHIPWWIWLFSFSPSNNSFFCLRRSGTESDFS